MSADSMKFTSNGCEIPSTSEEQQKKIDEVRRLVGPLPDKLSIFCSDQLISRYLRARNWNIKKATKMLKDSLKWRMKYKPEEIKWDEVAREAETGKLYRMNYADKYRRSVLVMRPSRQNSKSVNLQIRYLVYCMENAIMNMPENQEEMVWLIDFHGFSSSNISVNSTRETARVLQDHYPERLGVAILYNPPKFFEPFYKVVKAFLEHKTANKVKFVYSDDPNTKKIMEDLFDMDKVESAFGGKDNTVFDIQTYAQRMREDDKRAQAFWARGSACEAAHESPLTTATCFSSTNSDSDSDGTDEEVLADNNLHVADVGDNAAGNNGIRGLQDQIG